MGRLPMNEQILELAKQAGFIDRGNGHTAYMNFDHEKFAELIVRECIQVVDDMADPEEDSDRYFWAIQNASEKIKEHFGVE
jgi:hypothetical protein